MSSARSVGGFVEAHRPVVGEEAVVLALQLQELFLLRALAPAEQRIDERRLVAPDDHHLVDLQHRQTLRPRCAVLSATRLLKPYCLVRPSMREPTLTLSPIAE